MTAHHFPHLAATSWADRPWPVAHHARFHLLPTMCALPRGQIRSALGRCELTVALPKRGAGVAQGDVGQESRPPWQACPCGWHCPSRGRRKADGDVIVPVLDETWSLGRGREPLLDVYHRPEKRGAQGEGIVFGVRALHVRGTTRRPTVPRTGHVWDFGSLRNRVSGGHLRVLEYRLPSLDHSRIGETWRRPLGERENQFGLEKKNAAVNGGAGEKDGEAMGGREKMGVCVGGMGRRGWDPCEGRVGVAGSGKCWMG